MPCIRSCALRGLLVIGAGLLLKQVAGGWPGDSLRWMRSWRPLCSEPGLDALDIGFASVGFPLGCGRRQMRTRDACHRGPVFYKTSKSALDGVFRDVPEVIGLPQDVRRRGPALVNKMASIAAKERLTNLAQGVGAEESRS